MAFAAPAVLGSNKPFSTKLILPKRNGRNYPPNVDPYTEWPTNYCMPETTTHWKVSSTYLDPRELSNYFPLLNYTITIAGYGVLSTGTIQPNYYEQIIDVIGAFQNTEDLPGWTGTFTTGLTTSGQIYFDFVGSPTITTATVSLSTTNLDTSDYFGFSQGAINGGTTFSQTVTLRTDSVAILVTLPYTALWWPQGAYLLCNLTEMSNDLSCSLTNTQIKDICKFLPFTGSSTCAGGAYINPTNSICYGATTCSDSEDDMFSLTNNKVQSIRAAILSLNKVIYPLPSSFVMEIWFRALPFIGTIDRFDPYNIARG